MAALQAPNANTTAALPQANTRENRDAIVISQDCFGF
jgi:hypothetical protein